MTRRPARSTRTDTLFPQTTRCRVRVRRGATANSDAADLHAGQGPAPLVDAVNLRGAVGVVVGHEIDSGARLGPVGNFSVTGEPRRRAVAERCIPQASPAGRRRRSEEHTSELQSLMRISYAVF